MTIMNYYRIQIYSAEVRSKTSKHMTPLPKSECFYEQSVKSMPVFCPCSGYIIEIIMIVILIDGLRVSIPI